MLGKLNLSIGDPVAIQDMLVTNGALCDKTGLFERVFSHLLGNSFLFSRGDELWKQKRKAVAHAFYKNRLIDMLDVFKVQINETQEEWLK